MTFRSPRTGRSLLLPALFCALLPTAAPAQWSVDAAVGRAVYDPLATRIGALNVSLGVRHHGARPWLGTSGRWAYLSGGTDLGAQGLVWGAAGLGGRLGLARGTGWSLGVEMGANGFRYSESSYEVIEGGRPVTLIEEGDYGATVEAAPTLELVGGPLAVELRSGLVTTMGPYEDEILSGEGDGEFLAVTAFDGGASVAMTPLSGLQVGASGRYMRFPEGGYPYLGGSAQYSRGPGTLWAFAGRWLSDSLAVPRTAYGLGGSLRPLPGFEVMAGWQQEPSDPLYFNPPRRTWSVRLSRTLGTTRRQLPAVVPAAAADGLVAIRLPLSAADEPPSVVGDFTEWKPVPMVRVGDYWQVRLPIPPGIHHYGFHSGRGEFFLPPDAPAQDDGMGGKSAVLVVP